MKILVVHNRYQQPGGEDVVFNQEVSLLRSHGHEVMEYVRSNDEIKQLNVLETVWLAKRVIWASDTVVALSKILESYAPDVVHFHNTFLMISPAAYYACRAFRIPVVQTIHNYRLLCPRADLFRNGYVCEQCLGKTVTWPAIYHRCYHGSSLLSAGVTCMLLFHKAMKTWARKVNVFVALTGFSRAKLIQGGLPADRIVVKPNFVWPDPGKKEMPGEFVVFAGRFSPEKRVSTLLTAWEHLTEIPLRIFGDGPEKPQVKELISRKQITNVQLVGFVPRRYFVESLKQAKFLVFPSEWYEGFPIVIAEAFATGTPVIASRIGSMEEIVTHGKTGLFFSPGDPHDLATKVRWAWDHPNEMHKMGLAARKEYEEKYGAHINYEALMRIYDLAKQRAAAND